MALVLITIYKIENYNDFVLTMDPKFVCDWSLCAILNIKVVKHSYELSSSSSTNHWPVVYFI